MATYIYVLKLKEGNYYVGKTTDVVQRYVQHQSGLGCEWTKVHAPEKLHSVKHVDDPSIAGLEEERLTKDLMFRHGVQRVRGGPYTAIILSAKQVLEIQRSFMHASDSCFSCGEPGHFATDCRARAQPPPQLLPLEAPKPPPGMQVLVSCFHCGEPGHFAADCAARAAQLAAQDASSARAGGCFHCGEQGHFAANCRAQQATSSRQQGGSGSAAYHHHHPPRHPFAGGTLHPNPYPPGLCPQCGQNPHSFSHSMHGCPAAAAADSSGTHAPPLGSHRSEQQQANVVCSAGASTVLGGPANEPAGGGRYTTAPSRGRSTHLATAAAHFYGGHSSSTHPGDLSLNAHPGAVPRDRGSAPSSPDRTLLLLSGSSAASAPPTVTPPRSFASSSALPHHGACPASSSNIGDPSAMIMSPGEEGGGRGTGAAAAAVAAAAPSSSPSCPSGAGGSGGCGDSDDTAMVDGTQRDEGGAPCRQLMGDLLMAAPATGPAPALTDPEPAPAVSACELSFTAVADCDACGRDGHLRDVCTANTHADGRTLQRQQQQQSQGGGEPEGAAAAAGRSAAAAAAAACSRASPPRACAATEEDSEAQQQEQSSTSPGRASGRGCGAMASTAAGAPLPPVPLPPAPSASSIRINPPGNIPRQVPHSTRTGSGRAGLTGASRPGCGAEAAGSLARSHSATTSGARGKSHAPTGMFCTRCGRNSHTHDRCFASTHYHGHALG